MVVYSFYIFDRHGNANSSRPSLHNSDEKSLAECIYKRRWLPRPSSAGSKSSRPTSDSGFTANGAVNGMGRPALSAEDDAKLIFGTVFSLRNMVRKLGGDDDR